MERRLEMPSETGEERHYHWITDYLRLKNVSCWELVQKIYAEVYHIQLPELPGIAAESFAVRHSVYLGMLSDYSETFRPFDGAVVAMGQGVRIHHVGVYTAADGGKVIHFWDGAVIADTLHLLRIRGFQIVKFYRHNLWPSL